MVKAHFKDSDSFSSRGEKRTRESEGKGVGGRWVAACNPPSITGTPIIKDKLQYTSLGYANSKLDASHQKSSVAIFCMDKSRMSA